MLRARQEPHGLGVQVDGPVGGRASHHAIAPVREQGTAVIERHRAVASGATTAQLSPTVVRTTMAFVVRAVTEGPTRVTCFLDVVPPVTVTVSVAMRVWCFALARSRTALASKWTAQLAVVPATMP